MPDELKIVENACSVFLDFRLSCVFEANLAQLPKDGLQQPIPVDVPLKGDWEVHIVPQDSAKDVKVTIMHGTLPEGTFAAPSLIWMTLSVLYKGCFEELNGLQWGPGPVPFVDGATKTAFAGFWIPIEVGRLASEHSWFKADDHHRFRIEFCIQSDRSDNLQQLSVSRGNACSAQQASLWFAAEDFSSPMNKSARLVFKRDGSRFEELWTTTSFLKENSPYFRTLFASGCSEAQKVPLSILPNCTAIKQDDESVAESENAWEDSDAEAERAGALQVHGASSKSGPTYREVIVKEASASTYRAVLLYLKTGYLAFAPLASNGLASRNTALKEYAKLHPDLLPPVSPKSVYRLAHLLQLDVLQKLALDQIASSLTVDGAAYELFHPVSVAYDEVRDVVRKFVIEHFEQVRATRAWKEQEAKANEEKLEGSSMVLFELIGALAVAKTT